VSARRDPLADPKPLIRKLYAYVAYVVGDGPEAEDLTSEAFERALRYRDSFDPRRGTPIAWLIGIARRCIADRRTEPIADYAEPEEQPAAGDLELEAVDRLVLRGAPPSRRCRRATAT
jgi:DNA-directed RNA polymerase specialized sigma24 family protein